MTEQAYADPATGRGAAGSVWGPARAAGRFRPVDGYAFALVALAVGVRAWAASAGWFSQDDFLFASGAVGRRLSFAYLFQDYDGHLMPGGFLWAWLQVRVAGMDHRAVVLTQVLLFAITAVAAYRLMRYLFGPRVAVLAPLTLYLFSTLTLSSYLWWSAALNHQPMQLAFVLAVHSHVRYVREGRFRYAVGAALAYTGGLFFFEKSVLILPAMAGLTALWLTDARGWRRITVPLRRYWAAWVTYLVPTVVFGSLYVIQVHSTLRGNSFSVGQLGTLARTTVVDAFGPALFGGPWSWAPAGASALAAPGTTAAGLCWVALAVLLLETLRRVPGAWRSWIFVGGYVVIDMVLVAAGRLVYIGPIVGREYRYLADAALPLTIALGFLLVGGVDRLKERSGAAAVARARVVGQYVLVGFVLSALWSTNSYVRFWAANPAPAYFATAQREIAARDGQLSLYDGAVPADILWPLAFPGNKLSHMLLPFSEQPYYDDPAYPLQMLDNQGHVRDAVVPAARSVVNGPDGVCGYRARNGGVYMPLDGPLIAWDWVVRVAYIAGEPAQAMLVVGDQRMPIELRKGLHAVFVRHQGAFDAIVVEGLPAKDNVCVTQGTVGIPQPLPGPPVS